MLYRIRIKFRDTVDTSVIQTAISDVLDVTEI